MAAQIVVHPVPTLRRAVLGVLLNEGPKVSRLLGLTEKELQKVTDTVLLKWSAVTCFFCGTAGEPVTVKKVVPGTPACGCLGDNIKSFETWLKAADRASYYKEHLKGWSHDIPNILDRVAAKELTEDVKLFTDRCHIPGCSREFTITIRHLLDAQKHLKDSTAYRRPRCCKPHAIERRKALLTKPLKHNPKINKPIEKSAAPETQS